MLLAAEDPTVQAAERTLAIGAAALQFYEPQVREGEIEAVHQFRVTVRRLRAAVELLAPVLHGSRLRLYRRELPLLGRTVGAVRDCDALGELIRKYSAALEPEIARALIPIYQALVDRRVATMRAMNTFLNSKRYLRLIERLNHTLTRTQPQATVRTRAPALLRPVARSANRAGARLAADSPPPVFHKLRTRLKRTRYAVEMLDQIAGGRTAGTLDKLRALQEELGELQDLATAAAWLRELATTAAFPPETLIAAGALIQHLNQRRAKVVDRAYRRWQRFDRREELSKVLAEVGAVDDTVSPATNGSGPR
jgi:CHAD domain-containing protein